MCQMVVSGVMQHPHNEECDWCGDDTFCYTFIKEDGDKRDICKECLERYEPEQTSVTG